MSEVHKDTIEVIVNKQKRNIPNDFGDSPEEFVVACGYNEKREWKVYRVEEKQYITDEDDRCTAPMVVSEGDRFCVIPKYVGQG